MSEIINNREYRQKVLKELIMELHEGKSMEQVKARFEKLIEGVSAAEISEMEQNLIMEGMPVEEVQRLCDVHAAVFKGSIEEIHKSQSLLDIPGHPLHTFDAENQAVEQYIEDNVKPHLESYKQGGDIQSKNALMQDFNILWDLDKHYKRKENLLFPYLERHGITAPPKVMWGVDDEIRQEMKEIRTVLAHDEPNKDEVVEKVQQVLNKITEMIFKEDSILFPMAIDTLTEDEWIEIEQESDEIGYCITEPQGKWVPERVDVESKTAIDQQQDWEGYVKFDTGILSFEEISTIFNTMPFDITFIDKDDIVKYFSKGEERIFARTKAVIGRSVQNCHPPASVHIVNDMLKDFKSGKKDREEFWINTGGLYVYIQYFAVRNEKSEYIGTLEVTQNIKPIQQIQGEKRLVAD
ncbi:MAG: DUF438 domain-containing protein [Clostridia bacterium]|nr:DUF438 domain-containing protein [Clostridia bacterium]